MDLLKLAVKAAATGCFQMVSSLAAKNRIEETSACPINHKNILFAYLTVNDIIKIKFRITCITGERFSVE